MIIKSMSRRHATFAQLIDYMEDGRQDKKYTIKNNLFSHKTDTIKKEFEHNSSYFSKRKDSVYMYHEVISITKSHQLNDETQKSILKDIIHQYIKKRALNNLVYGVLHDDKTDNFHYHLLISSNELEASKKHRLSKAEFSTIKKELEVMVLATYPKLQQGVVMNKPAKSTTSNKEYESKKRTGKPSNRDSIKETLKNIFSTSENKQAFFEALQKEHLEIYVRGKTIGIKDSQTQRKYRLKTLGMLEDFEKVSAMIEASEGKEQKNPKTEQKDTFQENRTPYKEKVTIKRNAKTQQGKAESSPEPPPQKEKSTIQEKEKHHEHQQKQTNAHITDEQKEIERRKELLRKSRQQESHLDSSYNTSR